MNTHELIKETPLFSELKPNAQTELQKITLTITFSKDEMLFTEGEPAENLYILSSGTVDLIKSSPDGKEQLIRQVDEGETFAEAAMFSGESYPVTAIARSKGSLLVIHKNKFLSFIKKNPEISMQIMGAMAKLLRHLNQLITKMTLGSVQSRLAAFIIKRSRESGSPSFELGMKKQELAFQLGTISETLSRNLRKLQDDGIIEVNGQSITIKNATRLNELSE